MKKLLALLLAMSTLFALPSCGDEAVDDEIEEDDNDKDDDDDKDKDDKDDKDTPKKSAVTEYSYYTVKDGFTCTVYCNNQAIGSYELTEGISDTYRNSTGSVQAFTTYDGKLIVITPTAVKTIEESANQVYLSEDGKFLTFQYDDYNDEYIYLYDIENGTKTEVYKGYVNEFVVSPNAKTILYSIYDREIYEDIVYLYKDGTSTQITANLSPVAVSDDGKYIYMQDYRDLYLYSSDGSPAKLLGDGFYGSYVTNADLSQIMFIDDGECLISVEGSDPVMLFDTDYDYCNIEVVSPEYQYVDMTDLGNKVYYNDDDSYYYVNGNKNASVLLADEAYNFTLGSNGRTAFYEKRYESGVYKVTFSDEPKTEKIVEESDGFKAAPNGTLYYMDDDWNLHYLEYDIDREIAENIKGMFMTSFGTLFYGDSDYVIHALRGSVSTIVTEDYDSSVIYGSGYIIYTDENGVSYRSTDGVNFSEFTKDASVHQGVFGDYYYW